MSEFSETLARLREFRKKAFQPSPPPMDPSQQGGPAAAPFGAPPQGGPPPGPPQGGPPMDPSQGGMPPGAPPPGGPPQGGPPMDPSQGGAPQQPQLPPELEQVISNLAGGLDNLAHTVEQLQAESSASKGERQTVLAELEKLKAVLKAPAPMQGGPQAPPSPTPDQMGDTPGNEGAMGAPGMGGPPGM